MKAPIIKPVIEPILDFVRSRGVSVKSATQIFMQFHVLKHLNWSTARFMGGTALVMGYQNPRFSEDVDLTHVKKPLALKEALLKASQEIETWLGDPVNLLAPNKSTNSTWRLICQHSEADSTRLHIDSQIYPAHSTRPLVVEFPSLNPIVVQALSLQEILAEKILALAYRRYLGGRDLFDIWYHCFRHSDWELQFVEIQKYLKLKLKDRKISEQDLWTHLEKRVGGSADLTRARQEWMRYLPHQFQQDSIFSEILNRSKFLMSFRKI